MDAYNTVIDMGLWESVSTHEIILKNDYHSLAKYQGHSLVVCCFSPVLSALGWIYIPTNCKETKIVLLTIIISE